MNDVVTETFGSDALRHHFVGGVYAKETRIPAGGFVISHAHPYDHLSILGKGRARVEIGKHFCDYHAPAAITIRAGEKHRIIAISDIVWFCIHATEETDPTKVDDALLATKE